MAFMTTYDDEMLYNAYRSRDARFDGVFFIGITSTGIYCRPVCTARTPKLENCRFFAHRALAEQADFRPCLRCRPELAPGNAPIESAGKIAQQVVQRITDGFLPEDGTLDSLAAEFGISVRHIRRIVKKELGVSPAALMRTQRLLLAKQLLTETQLPIIDVAFASGFGSLRRFNDAFLHHYGMPPSRLRKQVKPADKSGPQAESSQVQLAYRPPYDWESLLHFLAGRALDGVEWVDDGVYYRTVRLNRAQGWIAVRHAPKQNALLVTFSHSLIPVLPVLLARLRHLFDLSARPDVINAHLAQDPLLATVIARHPGLRVPGAFEGFEMAVRAIFGQQITVKSATALSGRFAQTFGDPIETPFPTLNRLSPLPEVVAQADRESVIILGTIRRRAETVIDLAQALSEGRFRLEPGADPASTLHALMGIKGIGSWTAHYIAMRALRWPDAFPKEDVVLRNHLGGITAKEAEARAQAWRPWRSYAALHIWQNPDLKTGHFPDESLDTAE